MKIKNLAFFGIMASILSIGGAHALTPTDGAAKANVIASQAYVDAKDTATLNSANAYTDTEIQDLDGTVNTTNTASATAITSISQTDGKITAAQGQLTSAAISDSVDTAEGITSGATGLATAGAVYAAIDAAVTIADEDISDLEDRVETNEGNILTLQNDKQNKADSTVTGTKGTDFTYLTADNGVGANLVVLDKQIKTNADDISDIQNDKDTAASATWNDTSKTLTYATSGAAGNTTKLATSAQVSTTVKALEASVNNTMVSKADATVAADKAYVKPTYTVKGNLEALDGTLDGIVKTAFQSVDSTGTGEAVTTVTQDTTDLTQVNVTKSLLTYNGAMNSALGEINGQSGFAAGTNCTTANPCILSYTGNDYKWTQMVFPTTSEQP